MLGSLSVETHWPFSFLASSPPLAKTQEMPLRQSWPPRKKPEKSLISRGFFVVMVFTAVLNSSRVVGVLTPGLLPDVGAGEHVARAEVVGQRELLAVDRADVDEGLEQLGAAELLVEVGDVAEGADVGERRGLRVAELGDVGRVLRVGQRGRQLGDDVAPALLLDLERGAGLRLEGVLQVGPQLLGRVTADDPEGDRLAGVVGLARRRRRRTVEPVAPRHRR